MGETNDHLWNCPQVLSIITPIFTTFYEKYKTLITSESNSLYALYSDHITRNPIFKWIKKPPNQIKDIPQLHSLLLNFVPSDLTYPFKAAKINKQTTKNILLKFLFELHHDLYDKIWRYRSLQWKQLKKSLNLSKKSFTDYYRNFHQNNQSNSSTHITPSPRNDQGYHCPLNDTRRLIDNNNLWIYLMSSNFKHNLPWLLSLNEDLSRFSSFIYI
ncbi:hypothetical protein RhiirC2_798734 [Rhizophagus irregularis]|uniref:Uncharacterized protein n=1 Tax=Rhizophagus irregularis TaxID=588596 RepID=A0A2N1M601_9GLOM|nr:hypothetical protein RhiirC2_798734 [Rhizophagus irregularis]